MNLSQKLIDRLFRLRRIQSNRRLQLIEWEICRRDIFYWIENYCWTHDPRIDPSQIPIELYPFQKDLIQNVLNHIKDKKDLLVEKSRDMGVTWCFIYVFQHEWQFGDPGNDFLLGSRKQEEVDQFGEIKTLFEKLRYNLKRQPDYLLPISFDWKLNSNFMRLVNPFTGSYIGGESCNQYFGTGGRFKAALLDEFAKWDNKDEAAWQSLGDATPCRFPISSANGKNNHFYMLRANQVGKIDIARLHWRLHPNKSDAWYEYEKTRRSKSELAAEVDIDYSASVTNRAFENWNPSIHISTNGEFKYDSDLALELCCDFNIDPMCWSVSQDIGKGKTFTFKEYTEHTTITESVIVKFVRDFINHRGRTVYIYGDASGKAGSTRSHESDYDIIYRVLKANNWNVVRQYNEKNNPPIIDRLNAANKRLSDWQHNGESFEFISVDCPKLIESIEQTQRKDDGIEKDGMEHHSDAWSYRIAKKYPIKTFEISYYPR